MYEPLFTAAEMRAAEERYPGYPETGGELMERAGAAIAREAIRAYPAARRFAVVCGGGANGGDGRIAARILREGGREAVETDDPAGADVVIDALFGTGFRGAPRPEAAATIERINASGTHLRSGEERLVHRGQGRGRRWSGEARSATAVAAATVCECVSETSSSRIPMRSANASVFPASVTPGFGGPTISISFHVKRTPQPSALPTASLPQKRAA